MNTNILDNFLINQLQIKKDLNWDFFMTLPIHKEFSEYDNKLIDKKTDISKAFTNDFAKE